MPAAAAVCLNKMYACVLLRFNRKDLFDRISQRVALRARAKAKDCEWTNGNGVSSGGDHRIAVAINIAKTVSFHFRAE